MNNHSQVERELYELEESLIVRWSFLCDVAEACFRAAEEVRDGRYSEALERLSALEKSSRTLLTLRLLDKPERQLLKALARARR